MSQPIQFESLPKIAIPSETKHYTKMKEAMWDTPRSTKIVVVGALFQANEDRYLDDLSCWASYFSPKVPSHHCFIKQGLPNGKSEERPSHSAWLYLHTLLHDKRILDVRYGDIDRDGDVDVAFKLTGGAIYVFHNLQIIKQ